MKFEIQTNTFCDGWINTFTEDDKPVFFDSEDKAQEYLAEFLADVQEAVQEGFIDDEYNPEDYRIIKVTA